MREARQVPEKPLAAETGYYGKIPSQGDFVASRFHRPLREVLDRWLQRAFEHELRARGDLWRASFARMPPWRFVLGEEVAGGAAAIGLMVPSGDRVGRVFPLFVAARLPGYRGPTRALCGERRWFDEAERLTRGATAPGFDLAAFERNIAALPVPSGLRETGQKLQPEAERSFWWTEGRRAEGSRFAAVGMPAPDSFGRFLGDEPVPAAQPSPVAPLPTLPMPTRGRLAAHAAAFSHAGTRLRLNADRTTDLALGHLQALCDGQGEGLDASQAAELTVERLSRIEPAERLVDLVAAAKGALGSVNTLLRTRAAAEPPSAAVAALLSCGSEFAALWAGDTRLYLFREGLMRLLTRDHVEVGLRRRLSRSVGGAPQFSCDVVSDRLQPGDRFLLASAALPRIVPERVVAARLGELPIEAVPEALVQEALVAGAADNVSAFAVEFAAGTAP